MSMLAKIFMFIIIAPNIVAWIYAAYVARKRWYDDEQ